MYRDEYNHGFTVIIIKHLPFATLKYFAHLFNCKLHYTVQDHYNNLWSTVNTLIIKYLQAQLRFQICNLARLGIATMTDTIHRSKDVCAYFVFSVPSTTFY